MTTDIKMIGVGYQELSNKVKARFGSAEMGNMVSCAITPVFNKVPLTANSSTVDIGISKFSSVYDTLIVFRNGVLIYPNEEYSLISDTQIKRINGEWEAGDEIEFIALCTALTPNALKQISKKFTKTITENTAYVSIGVTDFNPDTDFIIFFKSGVFQEYETDYTISGNYIYAPSKKPFEASEKYPSKLNWIIIQNVYDPRAIDEARDNEIIYCEAQGSSTKPGIYSVLTAHSFSPDNIKKGKTFKIYFPIASTSPVTITIDSYTGKLYQNGTTKQVSKLQAGIYLVSANGSGDFFLTSGDLIDYESTNVSTSRVLKDTTFVGTDGEIHNGEINILGGVTYTPGRTDQVINKGLYLRGDQIIKGDPNLLAENIVAGKEIFNTVGKATVKNLGGYSKEEVLNKNPLNVTYSKDYNFIDAAANKGATSINSNRSNIWYNLENKILRYKNFDGSAYQYLDLKNYTIANADDVSELSYIGTKNADKIQITDAYKANNMYYIAGVLSKETDTLYANVAETLADHRPHMINCIVLPNDDFIIIAGWDDGSAASATRWRVHVYYFTCNKSLSY